MLNYTVALPVSRCLLFGALMKIMSVALNENPGSKQISDGKVDPVIFELILRD